MHKTLHCHPELRSRMTVWEWGDKMEQRIKFLVGTMYYCSVKSKYCAKQDKVISRILVIVCMQVHHCAC